MFEDGTSQQQHPQQSKNDTTIPPLQLEQLNFSELYEDIEFKQLSRQRVSNSLYADTMIKQPLFCFFARILDIMSVTINHSRHLCNWGILNNILDYIHIEHRVLAGLLLVAQSTESKVSFTNALFRLQRILTGIAELRQRAIILKEDNSNQPEAFHEVVIDIQAIKGLENQKATKTKDAKISPSVLSKTDSIRKLSKGKDFVNSPQLNESESELVSATYEILFYAHKYSQAFLSGQNVADAEKSLLKELGMNYDSEKKSQKNSFSSSHSREKHKESDSAHNILISEDKDLEKEQKAADNERDIINSIYAQSKHYLQTQEKRINRKKLSSLDLGQNITETIQSFAKRLSDDQSLHSCSCPTNSCQCNCKVSSNNSGSTTPTTQYSPYSSAIISHRSRSVQISSSSINTPKSRNFHSPSIYASQIPNQPSGFELTTAPGAQYQQSLHQLFQEQQEQVNYHLRGLIHPSIKNTKPSINMGIDDHSSSQQPISEELPNDQEEENEHGIMQISKNPIWSGNHHQQLLHFPQTRNHIGLRKKAHSYAMPVMRAVQEEKEDNEGFNSVPNDQNQIRNSLSTGVGGGANGTSARPSLKRSSTSSQLSPTILREPKLSMSSQSDIDGMEFPQREFKLPSKSSKASSSSNSSIIRQNEEQYSEKQDKINNLQQQSNSSTSSSSSSSSPSSSSSSSSSSSPSSSSHTSSNNSQEPDEKNPKSQSNPFVPISNVNQSIPFRRGGIHTKTVKKHMTQGGREFNTLGVVVPNFSLINKLTKKEEERDRYLSKSIYSSKQPEELSLDWLQNSHKSESFVMETIPSNHNSQDSSTIDFVSLPQTDSSRKTQRDTSVESITEQSLISKPRNNTIFQRIINFFHKPDPSKISMSPPCSLNNSEMDNFPAKKLLSPCMLSSQDELSSKKIIKKGISLNGITFLRIKDLQVQEQLRSRDIFAPSLNKSSTQLFLSKSLKISTPKIAASSLYFANSQAMSSSMNQLIPSSPCIQIHESSNSYEIKPIIADEEQQFEKELAEMFPHNSCQDYDIQDRKNSLLNLFGKTSQQRIVQKKACLNYKELSVAIEENCDKHQRNKINKRAQHSHKSSCNLEGNAIIQEKIFFSIPKESANYLLFMQEEKAKTQEIRITSQRLSRETQIITDRLTLWSKLRIQVWRRIFYYKLYKTSNNNNCQIELIDLFNSSCLKIYLKNELSNLNQSMIADSNEDDWMVLSRKSLQETIQHQAALWNQFSAFP